MKIIRLYQKLISVLVEIISKKKIKSVFFNKKIFNFLLCCQKHICMVHARTTQYHFGFILDEYWHLYFLMGFGFGLVPLHPFGFAVGSRLGFFFWNSNWNTGPGQLWVGLQMGPKGLFDPLISERGREKKENWRRIN